MVSADVGGHGDLVVRKRPPGNALSDWERDVDSNGRFVVALSPGGYYLDPQSPDSSLPYPIGKPQTVTVQDGEWTQVTVSYDTGIR